MTDKPVPTAAPRPGDTPDPHTEVLAPTPSDTTPCWCRRRRPRLLLVREHDRERARRDHPDTRLRTAHENEVDDALLDMLLVRVRQLVHAETKSQTERATAEVLTTLRDLTARRCIAWGCVTEAAFRLRHRHGIYRQAWVLEADDPPHRDEQSG